MHEVALLEVQERAAEDPESMVIGPSEPFALMSTVGGSSAPTLTVTLSETLPPGPKQVIVYPREEVSGPVGWEPAIGLNPLQPPEAMHEVALLEVQERVAEDPESMVMGPSEPFALMSTEGGKEGRMPVTLTVQAVLPFITP
ncbi:MAG: hypothetical protein Q8P66_01210, partial [Candidatus Colwellbacteria bacterium]|nr:hypothetical protein [Candidatus Colwellbacteria bacterium]